MVNEKKVRPFLGGLHNINLGGNFSFGIYDILSFVRIMNTPQLNLEIASNRIFTLYDCDGKPLILNHFILRTVKRKVVFELVYGGRHKMVLEKGLMGLISLMNRFNKHPGLALFLKLPLGKTLVISVPNLEFVFVDVK